jgi:hypothetical protein
MATVLELLMALWLVCAVLALVVSALSWLAVLCVALLIATVAYGFAKGIFSRPTPGL